jgi:pyrroline-5-carboxylate reductase
VKKKIGIIGLGNMGEAVVRALLGSATPRADILAYEIKSIRSKVIQERYDISVAAGVEDLVSHSGYVIMAVKPQDAKQVLSAVGSMFEESKILISIMAGITIANLTSMLGKAGKIVRVMPNICISVAEGALGVTWNSLVSSDEMESTKELLLPLGRVIDVTEDQMDAVTALSGSGPAFVLSFLEALIDGGVKMGLPRDKARNLAVQTMKGTIDMLDREDLHPALMKESITSPGGTTIAGLTILEEKGLKGVLIRCLEAAQARSRELSK